MTLFQKHMLYQICPEIITDSWREQILTSQILYLSRASLCQQNCMASKYPQVKKISIIFTVQLFLILFLQKGKWVQKMGKKGEGNEVPRTEWKNQSRNESQFIRKYWRKSPGIITLSVRKIFTNVWRAI